MACLAQPVVLHLTKFVLPTRHDVLVTMILTCSGTIAAGLAGAWLWQRVAALAAGMFDSKQESRSVRHVMTSFAEP